MPAAAAGVPVIGIDAGPDCSTPVLVIYDALGIRPGRRARFVIEGRDVAGAPAGSVPTVGYGALRVAEHCF